MKKSAGKNKKEGSKPKSKVVVACPISLGKETNAVEEGREAIMEAMNKVMQIPEMVSEILQYLPTCDIQSCNGVNRLWHQEARTLLLKRTRIEFVGLGIDTKILNYMEEMGEQCHHSMRIGIVENTPREMTAITSLAKQYDNKIKKIDITIGNPEFLRPFLSVKMLTVTLSGYVAIPPDLVMSSVKTLSVNVNNIAKSFPTIYQSMMEGGLTSSLLKMCPNLENLVLHDAFQQGFLKSLQNINPHEIQKPLITGLKLIGTNPLKWLSRCPFQLTALDIDIYKISDGFLPFPSTSLQEILNKFCSTLKHLKLHHIKCDIWRRENKFIVKFPIMPNLESLEITHVCQTDNVANRKFLPHIHFIFEATGHGRINYKKQFPILKNLSIKQVSNARFTSFEIEEIFNATCTYPCPNPKASIALYNMFFPIGTLPCPTVNHIEVNRISDTELWYRKNANCKCGLYCFCDKRKSYWKMLKMMADVFVNAVELKNFKESLQSN